MFILNTVSLNYNTWYNICNTWFLDIRINIIWPASSYNIANCVFTKLQIKINDAIHMITLGFEPYFSTVNITVDVEFTMS